MQSVRVLTLDQLMRFFRNAPDADNLEFYIKTLVEYHVLDYIKGNNWIAYHGTPKEIDTATRWRIMAFWIVAEYGYDNIREIILTKYPVALLFVTTSNKMYDVAVCKDKNQVNVVARVRPLRDQDADDAKEDDVHHIAVVPDHFVGRYAIQKGFDSYCIINPVDNSPDYYNGTEPVDELED